MDDVTLRPVASVVMRIGADLLACVTLHWLRAEPVSGATSARRAKRAVPWKFIFPSRMPYVPRAETSPGEPRSVA